MSPIAPLPEPPYTAVIFSNSVLNTALGFTVPVPKIYVNAVEQSYSEDYFFYSDFQDYDIKYGEGVLFNSPPGAGLAITATFTYLFLCRFSDDSIEFENFMYQLWSQKGLKFRSLV